MPVKVSSTLIRKIYETGHNSRLITNRTGAVHVVYLDVSLKLKWFLAKHTDLLPDAVNLNVSFVPEADTVHNIELIIGYVDRSH